MIRKRVLGVGVNSATLLVQDADDGNALRVLRRLNVSDWPKEDIDATVKLYETMKRKSSSMPHVVHIYTVLLQNTFLNIVMGFCEGGDLADYLQNNKRSFPEMTVFRWLLVLAQALKELQTKSDACFYGLALDHVFIDAFSGEEGNSIPARLRMGLPVSKRTYFTILDEKQRSGVALDAEYPPEVLKDRQYHPVLSDIWHLGKTGDQLLSMAKIPSSSRSPGAQRLLEKMLTRRVDNRPSIDQVITAMSVLAKLESNEPPVRPPSATSGHGHGATRTPADAASLPSARDVAAIRPRRRVSSTADWMMPPESENSEANPGIIVERLAGSQTREASVDRKTSSNMNSSHNTHNNNHSDSAALTTPRPTGSNRATPQISPRHGNRVDSARSSSWHRGAMERMEELERLNTNSPKTGRGGDHMRYASANRTPLTDERRRGALRGGEGAGTSSQRYIDAVLDMHINAGTTVPFHYDREEHGKMDHNTRVIKQMLGEDTTPAKSTPLRTREAGVGKKKSSKVPRGPKGFKNPPFAYAKTDRGIVPLELLPDADEARSTDIKKSIKKWNSVPPEKDNCVVTKSDGVFIYAPKLRRRDEGGEEEAQPYRKDSPRKRSEQRKKNRIPVSIAVPPGPPLTGESNLSPTPAQRSTPPPPPTAKAFPEGHVRQERPPSNVRSSNPPPQSRAAPLIPPPPPRDSPRHAPPTTPPSAPAQPERRLAPPNSSTPVVEHGFRPAPQDNHSSRSAEPRRAPPPPPDQQQQVSARRPGSPTPPHNTTRSILVDREDSLRHSRRTHRSRRNKSQDSSVVPHSESAMMEWAVDSIRSSIRSLVKDRTRYGEVMLEVAAFVRKPEEERLSVEENGKLVRRLHAKLQIQDERIRDAAVSLCSQLVALEGLGKLLRENSQS